MVANGRPFHFGMFALSGKHGWGVYGYPNVSIVNSDFFLPNPRNIQASLNTPVWEAMKRSARSIDEPQRSAGHL